MDEFLQKNRGSFNILMDFFTNDPESLVRHLRRNIPALADHDAEDVLGSFKKEIDKANGVDLCTGDTVASNDESVESDISDSVDSREDEESVDKTSVSTKRSTCSSRGRQGAALLVKFKNGEAGEDIKSRGEESSTKRLCQREQGARTDKESISSIIATGDRLEAAQGIEFLRNNGVDDNGPNPVLP